MASELELTTGERKALLSSFSTFKPLRRHAFGRHTEEKKIIKKNKAIRKLFGLADGDLLIDISADINSFQAHLPGRLFVMDKYILFFSDMFRVEQKVTIPMADVFKLTTDPPTNTVKVEVASTHDTYTFRLTGRYKDDILQYFKTRDVTLLTSPRRTVTNPETDTLSDDEDDEGLEWISRAAKEEGFLNSDDQQVVITEELPVSIKRFYDLFLKDEKFFFEFYKHAGRTEINAGSWHNHEEFGYLRQFSYRVKVNSPIGPPTTQIDETQRYYNQSGNPNHIVLEMSRVARDVKYGSSFRVESKFDILGSSNSSSVRLEISVGVFFINKILVPGISSMIKSRSMEESKISSAEFVAFAKEYIEEHSKSNSGPIKIDIGTVAGSGKIIAPRKRAASVGMIEVPSNYEAPLSPSLSAYQSVRPAPTPSPSTAPPRNLSDIDTRLVVLLVVLLLINIYFGFHATSINKKLEHLEDIISKVPFCKNALPLSS